MNPKARVLMFVENRYPNDPRVKNEAETLTAAGYFVMVVCLRYRHQYQKAFEVVNGVHVYRFTALTILGKGATTGASRLARIRAKLKTLIGYVLDYVYFTTACFVMSVYLAAKSGFDVIHAHNPPDTLWLVALPWRLVGKKYVFDHHDLSPELYRSRYSSGSSLIARVLQFIEWANLKLANVTIATNESYKELHIRRGGRNANTVFVVRNGPDARWMTEQRDYPGNGRPTNKKILAFMGALNPQDGGDCLVRAVRHLRYELGREDFKVVIVGRGDSLDGMRRAVEESGLDDDVEFRGYLAGQELRQAVAGADICLEPAPSNPLNDVSTCMKVLEYMACEKPVVLFDLKENRFSVGGAGMFVAPNDELEFARAIAKLMDDDELRSELGHAGRKRVEQELQWSIVSRNLVGAYAYMGLGEQPN